MKTYTTCSCGKSIELNKNAMGWLVHTCKNCSEEFKTKKAAVARAEYYIKTKGNKDGKI